VSADAVPGAESAGDPRVYFAGERTLLAWIRTGTGVVALRFTARLAPAELPSPRAAVAPLTLAWSLVGVGLVLLR
jgi:putative membrane protein